MAVERLLRPHIAGRRARAPARRRRHDPGGRHRPDAAEPRRARAVQARPDEHPARAGAASGIERDGDGVRIGALCTITELHARPAGADALRHPRRGLRPFRQRPDPQRRDDRRQRLQRVARRRSAAAAARARRRGRTRVQTRTAASRRAGCRSPSSSSARARPRAAPGELLCAVRLPLPRAGLCRPLLQVRHAAGARHLDDLDRPRRRARGRQR